MARVIDFPQYNQTVTYMDFGVTSTVYEIIVVRPGKPAESNESCHVYDECCTVLSGQLTLEMSGESYILNEGDSIYIKKNVRHAIFNRTDNPCQLLGLPASAIGFIYETAV